MFKAHIQGQEGIQMNFRGNQLAVAVTMAAGALSTQAADFKSGADRQMWGLGSWDTEALFTVDETISGYTPPGILDGIGAVKKNPVQVYSYVNHELPADRGYPYSLANGTTMTGARVSVFTLDAKQRKNNEKVGNIKNIELAYDAVYDRFGMMVTHPSQINEQGDESRGFERLCSANIVEGGSYNFEDTVFVTNEETSAAYGHPHGGSYWMLDTANRELWAAPDLGRGTWESATFVETGEEDHVALLLGDDFQAAPLYLYIGEKDPSGNFLERNGLSGGQLFVWIEGDNGDRTPEDWNGTGTIRSGYFAPVDASGAAEACPTGGVDAQGYFDDTCLRGIATGDADSGGLQAFAFSRPEDLATNPADGSQVVMASTGRDRLFPSDSWGTTYLIDMDLTDLSAPSAELTILYDGDDAGDGYFSGPDYGPRSPDNLEWAADGYIYIQEDRSVGGFCQTSGEEASIWQLDATAAAGTPERIAQINRSAVLPDAQTDGDPDDCGNWESSGIEDVTHLFPTAPGETLLLFDVQAHSVRDGTIGGNTNLVQGGQLLFLSNMP
jgi:hypothetical protein